MLCIIHINPYVFSSDWIFSSNTNVEVIDCFPVLQQSIDIYINIVNIEDVTRELLNSLTVHRYQNSQHSMQLFLCLRFHSIVSTDLRVYLFQLTYVSIYFDHRGPSGENKISGHKFYKISGFSPSKNR